jgi:hypothetical protein
MRDIMNRPKAYGPAAGAAVLAAVLFLAAAWGRWGTGQEKPAKPAPDPQKWTVETHDGTNFPLVGRHRTVACAECHVKGVFEGTPTSCEACHWDRRQDDRYRLRLGAHCGDCHTPTSWKNVPPNAWDHETMTGFRREGVHRTLDCAECHGEDFRKVGADCYSCHAESYRETKDPDHVAARFPTECTVCHMGQKSWSGAVFGHEAFPRRGRHQAIECSACHPGGRYQGTPADCAACHIKDYNATTDPNHRAGGFPTDCAICHGNGAVSWSGAVFNHEAFPLRGRHLTLECAACHPGGLYQGTPTDCAACHIKDYNATTDPNHKASGFPTDCVTCHGNGAAGWEGASFDHSQFFALKGSHATLNCNACHAKGYNLPKDCYGCHAADYNATTDPNHKTSGFPTDCVTCHGNGAVSWEGASFNHEAFPLKGRHQTLGCAACHPGGRFQGTPTDCAACHIKDYNATTDPNHKTSGFPTDCVTCHGNGAVSWAGASFNHSQFFALKGAHATLDCNACHAKGYNLPNDCYGCHAADYSATTEPNHKASGFPTTCETCHLPTHTSWSQAVFQHAFPIKSGKHVGFSCTDCHLTSNYRQFSCTDCHTHAKASTDSHHGGVGGYVYNSANCYACHPRGIAD